VGNRLSSLSVSPYSYNTSNELTSTPSTTYTFDYNGNVLTSTTGSNATSYAWDFENRLTTVTLPGSGGTVNFKYDPFGRRIYKSSSSTTSIFAYDGVNLIEETNSSGAVVARYAQTENIDEPLAMLRSSATSYYDADGLGSVTSLSNAAGALAQTYTFDSFGEQTASSGSLTNPFQYTGREFDTETGLYFLRARYYDPSTGRFISEDPSVFEGGMNFYPYVDNNATNYFDATGLQKQKSKKKPKPPVDPCPKEKRCFFNWLDGPLGNMANDLGTTKALMFTMAAKEGGWTQPALDWNMPLNNPFGVNKTKNGQAIGNINYPSLPAAIAAWEKMYGDRVGGDQDPAQFVHDLQNPDPPGKPYNSKNPKYEDQFEQVYNSVLKFMKLCGINP
jgi:RHS repeat-associated protein